MWKRGVILAVVVLSIGYPAAALRVARVIGNNMVLQREKPVKIWGWTDPGKTVTVTFAGQSKTSAASGADSAWTVTLAPLAASLTERNLTVGNGTTTLTLTGILVGEVWLCGGQSNMVYPLWVRSSGYKGEWPDYACTGTDSNSLVSCPTLAQYSFIRMIKSEEAWPTASEVPAPEKDWPNTAVWVKVAPEILPNRNNSITSNAFFFAKKLYEELGVPVGIVNNSIGGTTPTQWASVEELRKIKDSTAVLNRTGYPHSVLFNRFFWPVRNFTVRGAASYIGENSGMDSLDIANHASIFEQTYRAMIRSWRSSLGDTALPLCIIQTTGSGSNRIIYGAGGQSEITAAQWRVHRSTAHTGFVVTNEWEHTDLHTFNRIGPAERMVRWAIREVYPSVLRHCSLPTWGSPVFKSMETQGNKLVLHFELMGNDALMLNGTPSGFVVAGADKNFTEAQAEIVNKTTVAIWSTGVSSPVAARFAWSDYPYVNLWTKSGLPVATFRTDSW